MCLCWVEEVKTRAFCVWMVAVSLALISMMVFEAKKPTFALEEETGVSWGCFIVEPFAVVSLAFLVGGGGTFLRRKIGTKSHTEQRDITRNIIH